jgi:hypothetical protein
VFVRSKASKLSYQVLTDLASAKRGVTQVAIKTDHLAQLNRIALALPYLCDRKITYLSRVQLSPAQPSLPRRHDA